MGARLHMIRLMVMLMLLMLRMMRMMQMLGMLMQRRLILQMMLLLRMMVQMRRLWAVRFRVVRWRRAGAVAAVATVCARRVVRVRIVDRFGCGTRTC